MILLAQVADPIRVVLVLFLIWLVTKLYDKGQRVVPTIVALAGAAVLLSMLLASMRSVQLPEELLLVHTLSGFCANLILWAFFAGLRMVYRWQTDR